jgi:hypothetical protein
VRIAVGIMVVLLVLPVLGIPSRDSFPLSDYPMFSTRRGRTVDVAHVLAVAGDGSTSVVPPARLGTDEVLTARAVIARAAADPEAALRLCEHVAASFVDDQEVVGLVVRVDRFDVLDYFTDDRGPIESREVGACPISR